MDYFWIFNKRELDLLKGEKGQSIIEYVMLLAVLASIGFAVLNHPRFKSLFGEDAEFSANLLEQYQYNYRHGLSGKEDNSNTQSRHDTYTGSDRTRFYLQVSQYPEE